VVPARDLYSVRFSDFHGNPLTFLYGYPWAPSWFGDGQPGTDNVQFGVNIELKDMVHTDPYTSTATLGFSNYSVDIESSVDKISVSGVKGDTYTLTYQTVVENTGTATASDIAVTFVPIAGTLTPTALDVTTGTVELLAGTWTIPSLASGEIATGTLTMQGTVGEPELVSVMITGNDGQVDRGPWFFDTEVSTYSIYLPLVMKGS
jgi:hypothetical protein